MDCYYTKKFALTLLVKSVDQLIDINNDILTEIRIYFTDLSQKLHQLQIVYERMTHIHYYFERKDEYQRWSGLLEELEKVYQENTLDEEDEACWLLALFGNVLLTMHHFRVRIWIIGVQYHMIMLWTPRQYLGLCYQEAANP